jgi:hypothetical protein
MPPYTRKAEGAPLSVPVDAPRVERWVKAHSTVIDREPYVGALSDDAFARDRDASGI